MLEGVGSAGPDPAAAGRQGRCAFGGGPAREAKGSRIRGARTRERPAVSLQLMDILLRESIKQRHSLISIIFNTLWFGGIDWASKLYEPAVLLPSRLQKNTFFALASWPGAFFFGRMLCLGGAVFLLLPSCCLINFLYCRKQRYGRWTNYVLYGIRRR